MVKQMFLLIIGIGLLITIGCSQLSNSVSSEPGATIVFSKATAASIPPPELSGQAATMRLDVIVGGTTYSNEAPYAQHTLSLRSAVGTATIIMTAKNSDALVLWRASDTVDLHEGTNSIDQPPWQALLTKWDPPPAVPTRLSMRVWYPSGWNMAPPGGSAFHLKKGAIFPRIVVDTVNAAGVAADFVALRSTITGQFQNTVIDAPVNVTINLQPAVECQFTGDDAATSSRLRCRRIMTIKGPLRITVTMSAIEGDFNANVKEFNLIRSCLYFP